MKCLRDRAVACRDISTWHASGSACRLHSRSLARRRGPARVQKSRHRCPGVGAGRVRRARGASCRAEEPRRELHQLRIYRLPGRVYRIDERQSELRILVYRAGPLARLGHNHVMVNRVSPRRGQCGARAGVRIFAERAGRRLRGGRRAGAQPRGRGFRRRRPGRRQIRDSAQHAEHGGARRRRVSDDHRQERAVPACQVSQAAAT